MDRVIQYNPKSISNEPIGGTQTDELDRQSNDLLGGRLYILYLLSHTQIIMISNRTQAGNLLLLFRKDLGLIGDFVVCYFCEGSDETDAFFCTLFPHDIWPYASLYFTDVSLVK